MTNSDWTFNNNMLDNVGPSKWGGNCKLKHQSPVNIDTDFVKKCSIQCTLSMSYTKSTYKITNWKGKMLRINVDKGNNIFWNDQKYQLRSIDIHWPSMHTINGNKYQMELNFLHISDLGRKVYISVFLNVNDIQSEEASILDVRDFRIVFSDSSALSASIPLCFIQKYHLGVVVGAKAKNN